MNEPPVGSGADEEANLILSGLLEILEQTLTDAKTDCAGLPLFAVEARLHDRLRASLPGGRLTFEDIRSWAAKLSS